MSILNRKLYLNADKTKVVEEGSADAAFVLGGEGSEVSEEDVAKYKIPKKYLAEAEAEVEQEARPLTTADITVSTPDPADVEAVEPAKKAPAKPKK